MVTITRLGRGHWPAVARIYADGIATGHATFESAPPSWEHFDRAKLPDHRWVALDGADVVGWAAASAVSDRCVYAGVVEHSLYVDPAASGRGTGLALLTHLAHRAEAAGIWTVQAGVFPENTASLALHAKAGFHVVGTRRHLGRMSHGQLAGRWRDVVLLERRSTTIGVDETP